MATGFLRGCESARGLRMKKLLALIAASLLCFSPITHASLRDILQAIVKLYGVNLEMKDLNQDQLKSLNNLTKTQSGTHSYGLDQYDANRYAWGKGTDDWQQMLSLSRGGGGQGEVGHTVNRLGNEFPIVKNLESPNPIANDYYVLQAQTALAARASSEVAYKQAVRQETTMKQLHQKIDQTPDSKSAQDLSNRLSAENAMNSVQQTKLLAVLVQQAAIADQAEANRAKENKAFFSLK